jgi:hypothetical protein
VFSAPVRTSPSDSWVVYLCTDPTLDEQTILQAYALRWSIEVYFKEIKQHLGLWKEQSGRLSYGEVRDRQSGQIVVLTMPPYSGNCFAL